MKRYRHKKAILCLAVTFTGLLAATPARAIPPDPDNAALLYYQAFISFPKSHDSMSALLKQVAQGQTDPNEAVRDYVTQCAGVLSLTRAAAAIPACSWGYRYSQGFNAVMPNLSQIRSLGFLVLTEARLLAADGQYRRALENCLVCKQMGLHVSDEMLISFLVSVSMNRATNQTFRGLLGTMPPHAERLVWLEQELSRLSDRSLSMNQALKTEEQIATAEMRPNNPAFVKMLTDTFGDSAQERLAGTDAVFYAASRSHYHETMAAVHAILNDSLSYTARYDKLEALVNRVESEAQQQPEAALTGALFPGIPSILAREMEMRTDNRALQAALRVYRAQAETGQLPATPPMDMPGDAYSGKPFAYERTQDGFVLRCQAQTPKPGKTTEYHFKTP